MRSVAGVAVARTCPIEKANFNAVFNAYWDIWLWKTVRFDLVIAG